MKNKLLLLIVMLSVVSGCSTMTATEKDQKRSELDAMAEEAIAGLIEQDENVRTKLDASSKCTLLKKIALSNTIESIFLSLDSEIGSNNEFGKMVNLFSVNESTTIAALDNLKTESCSAFIISKSSE